MPLSPHGRVVEALRQATVQIRTSSQNGQGSGSGIVVSSERVVTNAHVVPGTNYWVESWEGKTLSAALIKRDSASDLALLSIPGLNASVATLADSDILQPGTPVMAIGHPLGFIGALSVGIVQSLGRLGARFSNGKPWICSKLTLAPGNSGGPLANFQGEIVGVNTMIAGGLAFSIPSRTVQRFLNQTTKRAAIGIKARPVLSRRKQLGFLILEVDPGSSASAASLLPGDVLIAVDGHPFQNQEDFTNALYEAESEVLEFSFLRNSERVRKVSVRLPSVRYPKAA
jgi:serine protease Do